MMCDGRRLSRSHLASTFCFGAGKSALGQLPTCPVDARLVSFVPEADIRLRPWARPEWSKAANLSAHHRTEAQSPLSGYRRMIVYRCSLLQLRVSCTLDTEGVRNGVNGS